MRRSLPRRPGCLLFRALQGVAVGLVVALSLHFACILLGTNFRTVLPGRVYRSAQLSPAQLETYARSHGIRTVVNLRGCCVPLKWYQDQAEVTARLDIGQEDISFSATRMPSAASVRQLVEVIERSEQPLLFHCHQGADRTGLASVLAVLLLTDAPLDEANRQLGLASGHVALGRTAHIDRFFDLYRAWLRETGRGHSPAIFRLWATAHYCPDGGRASFELLPSPPSPLSHRGERGGEVRFPLSPGWERGAGGEGIRVRRGESKKVTVRCHNTSLAVWRFEPGVTAGTHGMWRLLDRDERLLCMGRTGLRRARVEVGEFIDLDIPLPPLPPGPYTLYFDLVEEQQASFLQLGNQMLAVRVQAD